MLRNRLLALSVLIALPLACSTSPTEASVKPGINESFLDPDLDVDRYVSRFEIESREVFAHRHRIARAVGIKPGMAVADVGAGTGVFIEFFAQDVGEDGVVYAVDIAPKFLEHIAARAARRGSDSVVRTVLCTEESVELPASSVDLVFLCDTYHHFEYPQSTLSSIRDALRPGGRMIVVDFERIPGESSEWILDHVRAGKEIVIAEILAAGFELESEVSGLPLEDNYMLRFRRS